MKARNLLVAFGLVLLLTEPARADNCSGLSDCFGGNVLPAVLLILGLLLLIAALWYFGPALLRLAPYIGRLLAGAGRSRIAQGLGRLFGRGAPRLFGQGLKNVRTINSGRLAGYSRGNTELRGGAQAAQNLFNQLTGRPPVGGFDRHVTAAREVVYRASSASGPAKLEIISHATKFLEKISFLP